MRRDQAEHGVTLAPFRLPHRLLVCRRRTIGGREFGFAIFNAVREIRKAETGLQHPTRVLDNQIG